MLLEKVRAELTNAMKEGDSVKKSILRLVISEAGQTNALDDDSITKIMRKLIERNGETMAFVVKEERLRVLETENNILKGFLPRLLSSHEIKSTILQIKDELMDGKEGVAIG